MSTERAKKYGIEATTISKGIKETIEWYKANKNKQDDRYNSFTEE